MNPFDQPGVEAYKKNMFALLGKPGYEELRAAAGEETGSVNSLFIMVISIAIFPGEYGMLYSRSITISL